MKKLIYAAGVMTIMLLSCETKEELVVIPPKTKPTTQIVTKPDSTVLSKPDSILISISDSISIKPDTTLILKPDTLASNPAPSTPPVAKTPPAETVPSAPATPPTTSTPIVTTPPVVTTPPITQNPVSNQINIVFSQNFDKNTSGSYKESEWKIDWKYPVWANNKYGYGNIIQDGTNKYLMLNHYAGSFGASDGYQWETKFGKGYNELYFSYKIKFSSGFATEGLDGKLPGLGGGASSDPGNLPNGSDRWGGKYMFKGTQVKFYLYYMEMYKLAGDANPVSGKSYWGQGPYLNQSNGFKPGVWYTITQRIVMNTVGKADGLVEGYINGKLVCSQTGLRFRSVSSLMIDKINFGNFFGGSGNPPSKNENVCFDDFYVYTYNSSVNVARGNVSNSTGTTIPLPN